MGISKLIKNYRELGSKNFFAKWKQGIEGINPLQQTQSQILFTKITLVGISLGFVTCLFGLKNLWWLAIILFGAFGNTYISLIALQQKEKILKQLQGGLENV